MKSNQFLKLLSAVRGADDALGEILAEIAHEVLTQWHQHGNRTPHLMLTLALDGGVDENGWFTIKGEELRGVSQGVRNLFAGLRRLPKRDLTADVDVAAQHVVDEGMRTRNEAKTEAKAKREANAKVKAKEQAKAAAENNSAELIGMFGLVHPSGTVIELTEAEFSALSKTLTQLRALDVGDTIDVVVREVKDDAPANTEPALAIAA